MAIQIIKKDAIETELRLSGPVGIPLSEPPCLIKTASRTIPQRDHIDTGLWECSPGQFRREITQGEMMHLLSGHCPATPYSSTLGPFQACEHEGVVLV